MNVGEAVTNIYHSHYILGLFLLRVVIMLVGHSAAREGPFNEDEDHNCHDED